MPIRKVTRKLASTISSSLHISIALTDQAVISAANLCAGILLARTLGADLYGGYVFGWMLAQFASGIQYAIIITPLMTISAKKNKSQTDIYLSQVTLNQIAFTCVTALSVILITKLEFASKIFEFSDRYLFLLTICIVLMQIHEYLRKVCYAKENRKLALISDVCAYGLQIVGISALAITDSMSLESVIICQSIGFFFSLIIFTINGAALTVQISGCWKVALEHWKIAKWLVSSAIIQWTSGNYFIVVAGAMLGSESIGLIRACQNIMGIVNVIFLGLENITPIESAKIYHTKGSIALSKYLKKMLAWLTTLLTPLLIILFIFSFDLMTTIFGPSYAKGSEALQWWVIISFTTILGIPWLNGLRAIEQTKHIFFSNIMMTILSLAVANWAVINYGLIGALAGILATKSILAFYPWWAFFYHVKETRPQN